MNDRDFFEWAGRICWDLYRLYRENQALRAQAQAQQNVKQEERDRVDKPS